MQGTVYAEVHIKADGTIGSVVVTMAHPVFHDYVESALKSWRFESLPQAVTLKVVTQFRLDNCPDFRSDALLGEHLRETRVSADLLGHLESALAPT